MRGHLRNANFDGYLLALSNLCRFDCPHKGYPFHCFFFFSASEKRIFKRTQHNSTIDNKGKTQCTACRTCAIKSVDIPQCTLSTMCRLTTAFRMKVKSLSVFMFHVISRFYARRTLKPIYFDGDNFEHLAFVLVSKHTRRPT